METKIKYLITFKINSMAFKFENYCRKNDIFTKMVPVPTKLSKSCGYACQIYKNELSKVKKLCNDKKIRYGEIYKIEKNNEPEKIT
ncbi:MAG: DUF3343 domain-containing protein [Halanaerobiales bacterium]|nr:DUF3343 domain-containing protein [Halanaerobiales bacterium]